MLALAGMMAGFVSASVSAEVDPIPVQITRYKASHTLIVNTNLPKEVDVVDVRNLEQIAFRLTQGDVPGGVAETLGVEVADFAARTSVVVSTTSQSLEVTAVAETATAAEDHANTLAEALLDFLRGQAELIHVQDLESIQQRIDVALEELAEARTQGDVDEEARLVSTVSREQALLSRQESAGAPLVPLETLEPATASEISNDQYQAAVRAGATGNNIDTGVSGSIFAEENAPRTSGLPIPASPLGRAILGALMGLLVAVGITLMLDRMDPRLRNKVDVEAVLDLPVIAEIPPLNRRQQRETEVLAFTAPRSRAAEAYRVLRSSLDFARTVNRSDEQGENAGAGEQKTGAHVVLITSPGPSEGKTTTVANTAVVLAESDQEVLVVNCDFRRPRLTDYLGGDDEAQRVNLTSVPGVHLITHVLPDGNHTPADVLAAQRRVIERARDRFDVILLDTAPLLTTNDATDILESADQVVLVVSTGRTTRESADRAVELLERRNAPTLGVVLIGARDVPNAREYYYDGDDPYLTKAPLQGKKRSRRAVERSTKNRPSTLPDDIAALRTVETETAANPQVTPLIATAPAAAPSTAAPAPSPAAPSSPLAAAPRPQPRPTGRSRQPIAAGSAGRTRDRRPPLQVRTVAPVRPDPVDHE